MRDMEKEPGGVGRGKTDVPAVDSDGWVALEILGNIIPGDDPGVTWTKIDDGWRMSYENSLGTRDVDTQIGWRIIARDRAGAQTIEDHKGTGFRFSNGLPWTEGPGAGRSLATTADTDDLRHRK